MHRLWISWAIVRPAGWGAAAYARAVRRLTHASIASCQLSDARVRRLRTPRAGADRVAARRTLETYITGLKTGNDSLVLGVYYFGDRRSGFHLPRPIPIESYRITKEVVYDTAQARHHNVGGVVPPAQAGDVELNVEERIQGNAEMYSYWLRLIDGKWRIYAHTAWNTPD
jgi:hypothetical protein